MAGEIRLITPKTKKEKPEPIEVDEAGVPVAPSFLGRSLAAVHTLGSMLSAPSRAVWGGVNAATGGEGGAGNMNPFDSTGGIELDTVLANQGVIAKNDPTRWEIMPTVENGQFNPGDIGRGVIAAAGDPTSWVIPLGKTAKGAEAAMKGTLSKGLIKQISNKERALVSVRAPFQGVAGHAGTGENVASALSGAGNAVSGNPVVSAIAGSAPVKAVTDAVGKGYRSVRGLMDARYEGVTDPRIAQHMPERYEKMAADRASRDAIRYRIGRSLQEATKNTLPGELTPMQKIARALERTPRGGDVPATFDELGDPLLIRHAKEIRGHFDEQLERDMSGGTGHIGPLVDPAIPGYFTRYKTAVAGDVAGQKGAGTASYKRKDMFKGFSDGTYGDHGLNRFAQEMAREAHSPALANLDRAERINKLHEWAKQSDFAPYIIDEYRKKVKVKGEPKIRRLSRFRQWAEHTIDNPQLKDNAVFGDDPLSYAMRYLNKGDLRTRNRELVTKVLVENAGKHTGEGGIALRHAMKQLGFRPGRLGEKIAKEMGIEINTKADLKKFMDMRVDGKLIENLKFARAKAKPQAAAEEIANGWQQALNWFKGSILAFPASRVRDLASGYVKNLLNKWGLPGTQAYPETMRLMTGKEVKGDYRHLDFVKDWFDKSGLDINQATPAQQTEAVRQMIAVHLPREHSMVGDIATGQHGHQLNDLLTNVPGQQEKSMYQQFVGDPLAAFTEKRKGKWHPLGLRGVGGRTEATLAPVVASEKFSAAGDQLNRTAGFLSQIHSGAAEGVAAKNVNRAQIDYSPHGFSDTEKFLKRNLFPFYSFTSRSLPETARQLTDMGSPTAQLVKAQSRAYEGNPAVPEYILDSSGVPLGRSEDGTLRYLAGLGLMHDPATKMIGQAVSGDVKGLGANLLSGANPFIVAPTEQIFGTSLFRQGEPLMDLESNTGRLLANVGAIAGVRDKDAGPVDYPGRWQVDTLSSMTPVGRIFSTARKLTDVRRGPGKLLTQDEPIDPLNAVSEIAQGVAPAVSGLNYTEVSPQRQVMMLRRRAEQLAREGGAKQSNMVYFPKEALEALRQTDPELAQKQEQLQTYINSLRLQRKKAKAAE